MVCLYFAAFIFFSTTVGAAIVVWAIARFYLSGENLERFDQPRTEPLNGGREPSAELTEVEAGLREMQRKGRSVSRWQRLQRLRQSMEEMGGDVPDDVAITPVDSGGVPAEWVVAPAADPQCRLLYIHGGAFIAGSPRSHRRITRELSIRARAAVLAIDYRLMPEHRRLDSLADCQQAYRWMLENGPGSPGPAARLLVAGDSAGGNLALALAACIRDQGLRQPDGCIALSPGVDSAFSSPSLRGNADRDLMLGPMIKLFLRFPRTMLLWSTWANYRINPSDPRVSPVFGDLGGLPPMLIHASESEVLIDDARRYANKARAAGSAVQLETWHSMPHVWHIFIGRLPEARDAFDRIESFVNNGQVAASRSRGGRRRPRADAALRPDHRDENARPIA